MNSFKRTSIVTRALLCAGLVCLAFGATAQDRDFRNFGQESEQEIQQRLNLGLGQFRKNRRAEPGAVFVNTTEVGSNDMVVFGRAADGPLSRLQTIGTGGFGTADPTESQDAVVLSEDNTLLFTVNVRSDDTSV